VRELFPGFSCQALAGCGAKLFARIGGDGPPLLLLHGYPQTHVCWSRIAGPLAEHFRVIACDLRGYGASDAPPDDATHQIYSKRAMAADLAAAMSELGFDRFDVAGHDRGARAAYRLALDYPQRVRRLAVLGILPTYAMWQRLERIEYAIKAFRWLFLAQPAPLPEALIGAAPLDYLHATLADWTKTKDLSVFDPDALDAYRRAFSPSSIAASCADYRAGWSTDRLHDRHDLEAQRKMTCPTLALWGRAEFPDEAVVLTSWRHIAPQVLGKSLDCGHFLPEEASEDTLRRLLEFFG
jgi:haloacetate dehalogenase